MKKIVAILTVLLLGFGAAYSQKRDYTLNRQELQFRKNCAHIDGMLQKLQKTAKTTKTSDARTTGEMAERLIATSNYSFIDTNRVLVLTDSANYRYGADRSSIFNYNHMDYNPMYYIDGSAIMGFDVNIGYYNQNNKPSILYDTCLTWALTYYDSTMDTTVVILDSLAFYSTEYAFYDSSQNVTEYANLYLQDSTTEYYLNRFINNYDSSENIVNSLAFDWIVGNWDTDEYRIFMYDGSNRLVEDSTNYYLGGGSWGPLEKWNYTYDDSGNLIKAIYSYDSSGVWQVQQMYFMTYYPSNKLYTDSVCTLTLGTWMPRQINTFQYAGGMDFVTNETHWMSDGISTNALFAYDKHVNSISQPDTFYFYIFDTVSEQYQSYGKEYFLYDSYGEPTTGVGINFIVTDTLTSAGHYDTVPSSINHYYYEPFYDRHSHHTAVPVTPSPSHQISVFPNPATNLLNITISDYALGSATQLTLLNTAGQKVRTERLSWMQQTETFPMSNLAPGNYWLLVQDKNGAVLGKQQVVKE